MRSPSVDGTRFAKLGVREGRSSMKMMTSKTLRRIGLGLAIALPLIGLVVWYWVIPAAIVAAIRERHEGHVAISGWWINGASAGVTGLALHEEPAPSSPTWAAAERVSTDLSLGALLRGRFIPSRIVFDRASIAYRIGADGKPLTRIPLSQSGSSAVPEMVIHDSELAMRQEGRPEMVVHHLDASLSPDPDGPHFEVKADDPDWGHPGLDGRFTPDFSGLRFRLTTNQLPADPEKARRVPFIDETIWKFVEPRGPIGVVIDFDSRPAKTGGADDQGGSGTSEVATTVTFQGTSVGLPTLGLQAEDATGPLTVRDKIVRLDGVRGRMAGGRVAFSGPIDFQHKPDSYNLALDLDGVDLTALPESWQLHRLGVRGRFTGKAGLHLALKSDGIDLTGSSGDGVIDGAEVRGIPLQRLDLAIRSEGLRSPEDRDPPSRDREGPGDKPGVPAQAPLADARGSARKAAGGGDSPSRDRKGAGGKPSPPVGSPTDARGSDHAEMAGKEGPFLPQWIRGEFRVKNVELERAIARVEMPARQGGPREVPVSGRVDLDAHIRVPLGALDDLKVYEAGGSADVAGALIGGLDVGRVSARLNLTGGILEVADLRGRMVERPKGGGRPEPTEPPPAAGPLPRGGFRGRLRAELAGERKLEVEMEGVELPIVELLEVSPSMVPPSAPPTPRGLPVAGLLTIRATARAQGSDSLDPRTWTLSGRAELPEVAYRKTVVKGVTTNLAIDRGRLMLSDLSGRLSEAPLKGRIGIDLAEPWPYDGELDTGDLPCHELLGLIPNVPTSTKVEGIIAGRAEAKGTVQPWRLASSGQAKVAGLKVGGVAIGDVPVRWETKGETIHVAAEEHQRYGGRVSAEARVPVGGDGPIEGTVTLARVDAAELSAQANAHGSWRLTGHADGQGRFRYAPNAAKGPDDSLPLEAEAHLTAGDLKVGGLPARSVKLTLTMHEGNPRFDLGAEGLGGTVRLTGNGHLAKDSKDDDVRAQVEALGLQLYEVWGALGTTGALAELRGRASIKGQGQLRGGLDLAHARVEGTVELDEPIWGYDYLLGRKLQTAVSKTPDGWRVGPLGGELFGGKLGGDGIWMYRGGDGRANYGIDARIEQLELGRALGFLPEADRRFAARGTLRVAGRADGSSGGTLEFRVDRGQVNGVQLTGLRVPGEWKMSPDSPRRGELHVRGAEGRVGGGRVGGEVHFALGDRRDFRARLFVDDVDLRVVSRDEIGIRPVPGRLSGYVNVYGTDPANPFSYRGDLDFDLDQASLVDIPLLDELDRSLGSTQGGVFDDGDLHGTIYDRKVHIDELTLVGPLAQVHAAGTMDFDGRLNLEVVVNNNRGIYQSGQAIMARAPNVADEVARRASQVQQVRDFVSARLMKFRITGTIRDPIANVDRSINPRAALGFFLKTMRLSAQSR
jgi:translocation and assembly module TamB